MQSVSTSSTMAHAAKRWVFTLNKYKEGDLKKIKAFLTPDNCVYAVVGKEVGKKKKTPHLQGFVHLKKKRLRMSGLQKQLSTKARFALARDTDEQNQAYCTKEEVLLEVGQPVKKPTTQKSRTTKPCT